MDPARLLASAVGYQVLATRAPGKSRNTLLVPAWPNTAELGRQVRGLKLLPTWIVTLLCSAAPQMLAANWKELRRCWPKVVPALPPTGARGDGSLNPSPAPS